MRSTLCRGPGPGRTPSSTWHSGHGPATGCLAGGRGSAPHHGRRRGRGRQGRDRGHLAPVGVRRPGRPGRRRPHPAHSAGRVGGALRGSGRRQPPPSDLPRLRPVVDVDCAVGAAPCLTASDDRGYEIDEAEVVYWGRCPECLDQAPSAHPRDRQHVFAVTAADPRTDTERTHHVEVNVNMDKRTEVPVLEQGSQRQVEPRLVAEPVEPERPPSRTTRRGIRWTRRSTTPPSSRRSISPR